MESHSQHNQWLYGARNDRDPHGDARSRHARPGRFDRGWDLSVAAGRAARALLFGLDAWDPATLALACVTMTVVAALASWIPARRASRLAPTLALRED